VATITSAASGPWSAGSTWAGGSAPADNDTVIIAAGHSVEFDVDMSAWANGIAGLTIQGGATPGMLYAKHSAAGTYHLKMKAGTNIVGTSGTYNGRLLANSDGVWGNTGSLPFDRKFIIQMAGTNAGALNLTYLDCALRCDEPVMSSVVVTSATVESPVVGVATDVSADPQWWIGAPLVLVDEGARTNDHQVLTLVGKSATTLTLSASVDSTQVAGRVFLATRNVEIRSASTSASAPIVTQGTSAVLACAVRATAATTTTKYTYSVIYGSGHTLSGVVSGCTTGVVYGSGHTLSGVVSGCTTGVYYGSGHTLSGVVSGCTTGVYYGSGHTLSGVVSGCTTGVVYGSGHTLSGVVSGCTTGVVYGSGHTLSGVVSGCTTGVYYGSIRFHGATFQNNTRDLYSCITSGPATLGSTVQNGAYKYTAIPMAECRYTALVYPLGGVDGAIGCWTQGGYCKSATYASGTHGTPPLAPTLIHEQTFEDSNRVCYVELPLWLPKDAQMTVIFHGRLTGTASFLDLPRVEIVGTNGEWLTDVLDGVQMSANTDWQTLTAVYTNTAEAREVMLRVRGTGGNTGGTGTEQLYWFTEEVEIMPTAALTAIAAIQAKTDNLPAAPAATGDAMTLTADYDAAKTASQFDASADTVTVATNNDKTGYALTAAYDHAKDDVLTPLAAVSDAIAALPGAQVGTRIDETSTDSDGEVLGLATPGSTITAYLATDTDRSDPVRQTTAATDGSWALYLPAGTYTLVVTLDGYYDAADGDSEITRTVTVA
jgi:hypothetical protein